MAAVETLQLSCNVQGNTVHYFTLLYCAILYCTILCYNVMYSYIIYLGSRWNNNWNLLFLLTIKCLQYKSYNSTSPADSQWQLPGDWALHPCILRTLYQGKSVLGLGSMTKESDTDRKEAGGSPAVGWTGSQGTPVWSPPLCLCSTQGLVWSPREWGYIQDFSWYYLE